ncbi:unnamed protein product [Caenorhabditis nigoni]
MRTPRLSTFSRLRRISDYVCAVAAALNEEAQVCGSLAPNGTTGNVAIMCSLCLQSPTKDTSFQMGLMKFDADHEWRKDPPNHQGTTNPHEKTVEPSGHQGHPRCRDSERQEPGGDSWTPMARTKQVALFWWMRLRRHMEFSENGSNQKASNQKECSKKSSLQRTRYSTT